MKIQEFFKENRDREKKYLSDGKRAIARDNIRALSFISAASAILAILGMVLVKMFIGAPIRMSQILFIPALAVFAVVSNIYHSKGKAGPRIVWAISMAFEITVLVFMLFIDVIDNEDARLIFTPIVITALASGIFFPSKVANCINIVYTLVFIFTDMLIKVDYDSIWRYDVCMMLVGFVFAAVVAAHCRQLKIVEYTTKMKYKSLSMRDPLLENVYNKRGYEDAIDNYLISNNPSVNCAFIVLDLNDFKHINDNYGHDMGDQILRCMADTLVSLFRDSDIIGRFGGDEFIVLADGLSDPEAVENKCHYIADIIGKKAQETGAIKVFSSLGAVICDNQRVDFERLFELADDAMYEAKEMGRKADRFVLRHYSADQVEDIIKD